ncbi:MAG: Slp family lipoprotein [Pseudomonadota bacterium]|nr:Slp family lipoprotein [Pseudomonadota bacterium]
MKHLILISILLLLLSGCASGPRFDASKVDRALTPRAAVAEPDIARDRTVLWGGVILNIANLEDGTRLEVLSYPLDSKQRPRRDEDPMGRFFVVNTDYLEPTEYAEGRLLTVIGTFGKTVEGKIGETDYTYPVLNSDGLYLWSRERGLNQSNIHFGIGIGFGL